MKDYSKEELKIYYWMNQALKLDQKSVFYYADLFKQTDEGKKEVVIDIEELKFWTGAKDLEEMLTRLEVLARLKIISLKVEDEDFIVRIKRACRGIMVNRENSQDILTQLKNEPDGVDIAVIFTKMCMLGYSTNDVLYIDRFSPVIDCLVEGLGEGPKVIEKALEVLKRLDAIDY